MGIKKFAGSRRLWARGSYTVEASIMVPLLFFEIAFGMRMGLYLYQEIRQEREQQTVVSDFYKDQWISEGIND